MPAPHEAEVGRVTVCVRARPLNEREKRLDSPQCLLFDEGKVVRIYKKGAPTFASENDGSKAFTFDYAYDSDVGQQNVYEDMGVPVLDASIKGFNTCIFAYGQTGSGKSYCMMGPSGGRDVFVDPGIIPRLSKNLFARIVELQEENRLKRETAKADSLEPHAYPPELSTVIVVSYLEIYQEKVNCLLNSKSDNLKVREHPVLGVYVEGLTEVRVDSEESIMRLMNSGNQSRHIAATKMNDRSSRSHAIFAISVIQKQTSHTKEGATLTTELRAKINLVDLAGSERAKSTGAEGDTLREGATINKSLTVLGLVISALAELSKKSEAGSVKHVPYRDSTLTFILKESLGGNSKTFMLSTVSPAAANYDETLGTLRYADRAKAIVTRAIINENAGDKRIRELEDEITRLREKMRHYMELVQKGVVQNKNIPANWTSSCGETDGRAIEDEEINYIEAATPRQWRDAAVIEAELHRTEGLIQKIVAGEGKPLSLLEMYRTLPTVKVHRNDPFILNVDAAGEWVMEHLVADITYLGSASTPPDNGAETLKDSESSASEQPAVRCMVVSGPRASSIAPQHCCFVRGEDGRVLLRPLGGHRTFLNDNVDPVSCDTLLSSGDVVCIGDEYIEFKFTDPAAPLMTARRRGGVNGSGAVAAASAAASPPAPAIAATGPVVPALRLKEALQRKPHMQRRSSAAAAAAATTARTTPRTAVATGRLVLTPSDELCMTYRHTFLFIGACNTGKSACAENIRKPDKWYSRLLPGEKPNVQPTFGVTSTMIETSGPQTVHLQLMELGGCDCFSMLEGLLPTRRVTFVFCFSLCDRPCLQLMQPFLNFILSHTAHREPSVVVIGTHRDKAALDKAELQVLLSEIESDVNNYFHLLQGIPQMRPSIVGSFAVDNVRRTVFSPGVVQTTNFPELLCWFAEHAIQRCRNDTDFPNAQVPKRALALAKRIREIHRDGKWCLSSSEYKTIAKAVDSRYGISLDDLHRHTQLLHSWGILHHHYRHLTMKRHVVLDAPWMMRAIAVLSCCTPVGPNYTDDDGRVGRSTTLLTCRATLKNMSKSLPFVGDEVLTSDVYNLLPRGVVSMRTASLLFRRILAEKNFPSAMLAGLLDLLRSYDLIIIGSRLVFSDVFEGNGESLSSQSVDGVMIPMLPHSAAATDETDISGRPPPPPETFILIPPCFDAQVPSAFCLHVPSFLFGPFYCFTLSLVPRLFFSRVVCRVAQYADKIYIGPCNARTVSLRDVVDSSSCEGYSNDATAIVVGKSEFWNCTAWVISAPNGRALLRMVNHSLFITFHDSEDDTEFHDGLLRVVRNIIYETPGVRCEESLLCLREYVDEKDLEGEQHGDKVYWRDIDENVNSLEKIREREQYALMTARGGGRSSPDDIVDDDDDDEEEEEDAVIPFVRSPLAIIDEEASVKRICDESLLTDFVLDEVRAALHSMNVERGEKGSSSTVGFCKAIDKLVHALARA